LVEQKPTKLLPGRGEAQLTVAHVFTGALVTDNRCAHGYYGRGIALMCQPLDGLDFQNLRTEYVRAKLDVVRQRVRDAVTDQVPANASAKSLVVAGVEKAWVPVGFDRRIQALVNVSLSGGRLRLYDLTLARASEWQREYFYFEAGGVVKCTGHARLTVESSDPLCVLPVGSRGDGKLIRPNGADKLGRPVFDDLEPGSYLLVRDLLLIDWKKGPKGLRFELGDGQDLLISAAAIRESLPQPNSIQFEVRRSMSMQTSDWMLQVVRTGATGLGARSSEQTGDVFTCSLEDGDYSYRFYRWTRSGSPALELLQSDALQPNANAMPAKIVLALP
jgi:hypothetical protein